MTATRFHDVVEGVISLKNAPTCKPHLTNENPASRPLAVFISFPNRSLTLLRGHRRGSSAAGPFDVAGRSAYNRINETHPMPLKARGVGSGRCPLRCPIRPPKTTPYDDGCQAKRYRTDSCFPPGVCPGNTCFMMF